MAITSPQQMCGTLASVKGYGLELLNKIQKKQVSLQRIASLLERAAAGIPIPSINNLIDLASLDLASYQRLAIACPQLGLPTDLKNLEDFRKSVYDAYNNIAETLVAHPLSRMSKLDDSLNDLFSQFNNAVDSGLGKALAIYECIEASCDVADQVSDNLSPGLGNRLKGYATQGTQDLRDYYSVLNADQKDRVKSIVSAKDELKTLYNVSDFPPPSFL